MLFELKEYLAENSTEYLDMDDIDYLYEGLMDEAPALKDGPHSNDTYNQYRTTISKIINEYITSLNNKEYNKAEKLILEKKKILETLEKSISSTKMGEIKILKNELKSTPMFTVPPINKVTNVANTLKIKSSKNNELTYSAMLNLVVSCNRPITVKALGGAGFEGMKHTIGMYTKPQQTQLKVQIKVSRDAIASQLEHVRKLKSVKESYTDFSLAVENYIDTVLEDIIK